jgi:excisionase family DNA binding protein
MMGVEQSQKADSGFSPRIGRSVSLDHAAQLLGTSRRTVYNRIREGKLKTVRLSNGSQRVTIESLALYLNVPELTFDEINVPGAFARRLA